MCRNRWGHSALHRFPADRTQGCRRGEGLSPYSCCGRCCPIQNCHPPQSPHQQRWPVHTEDHQARRCYTPAPVPGSASALSLPLQAEFSGSISSSVNVNNFDNITFDLPNVVDSKQFMNEMINDRKFEQLIRTMTVDRMSGKSSVSKYKFRK